VSARHERSSLVFAAAGVVWAAAYLLVPRHTPLSAVLVNAGGFACAVAVVVGVRWHRPARRAPWYLFAAAQTCFGAGDVLWTVYEDVLHEDPFPSLADVLYLCAYPLFVAGLFLLLRGRTRGRDVGGLLDAMIISAGLGVLSWTFLMRPIAADQTLGLTGQLVALAYPLADVVMLGMLARLLTTPGARTASFRLLTAAMLALLAADLTYAALTTFSSYEGGLTDAMWILSYALWGAAALHPSMRTMTDAVPVEPHRLTLRRFALLGVTTLVAPGVLTQQGLTVPTEVDWPGVTIGSLVLYVLILARAWTLVQQVQDQSKQLAALAHSDALTAQGGERRLAVAAAHRGPARPLRRRGVLPAHGGLPGTGRGGDAGAAQGGDSAGPDVLGGACPVGRRRVGRPAPGPRRRGALRGQERRAEPDRGHRRPRTCPPVVGRS
jgi:hypothetical protein